MSSAVFSTTAAQGRFFVFDDDVAPEVRPDSTWNEELAKEPFPATGVGATGHQHSAFSTQPDGDRASAIQSAINHQKSAMLARVAPASRLEARLAPEMVTSGVAAIDALTGGLPRGCLTEICGAASSGRTTFLLAALAAATRRGEVCAVVDSGDALDPRSVAAAGIELDRLLWVRCGENSPKRHRITEKKTGKSQKIDWRHDEHRVEQLLLVTDLLLESGGFGFIALDFADLPPQMARRIPLTTWFRFRRAVEHTATVLLAIEQQSIAGSCSSLLLKLGAGANRVSTHELERMAPTHAQLLMKLEIIAEVMRSRLDRKPVRSAVTRFAGKTAWAG
jgi:recA bacterial DNA recombination protein